MTARGARAGPALGPPRLCRGRPPLRALDGGIVIAEHPGPPDDDLLDPRDEVATSSAAALEWCLEPTTGLWPLLDAGAVQVAAVDLAVDEVAAAWQRAADPYAPMTGIPGVAWTPVEVTVEQVLARSR